GALELRLGLAEPAELEEKVASDTGQEVVGLEGGLRDERVDELEARSRTEGHRDRHGAIQLHDRRAHELGEGIVARGDAPPVGFGGGTRASVTRGNGGLEGIRTEGASQLFRALEGGETAADEEVIPTRTILIEEQDRLAGRTDARTSARRLDLHEGNQTVDLRLVRNELGENPPPTQRVFGERRAHPVLTGGGRVAFVEDQVDHLDNGG